MQPINLFGSMDNGLQTDIKPLFLPEKAMQQLDNAYTWRGRVIKRQGKEFLGRLRRVSGTINFFFTGASPFDTSSLLSQSGFVLTANNANPGQVTTKYPHGLQNNDKIIITGILGATGYNNKEFTITVVDPINFTVGQDATLFGLYASGGTWISNRSIFAIEPNATLQCGSITYSIPLAGSVTLNFSDNYKSGYITNITQAEEAVVTTATNHNLSDGDSVTFQQVQGMIEINGLSSLITVIDATNFSCNFINSLLFTPYTANTGIYVVDSAIPNGFLVGNKVGVITAVTLGANPTIDSANHTLVTGNVVRIDDVVGSAGINGLYFTVTVLNANQFQINGTTTTAYGGGGIFTAPAPTEFGTVNYVTGILSITTTAAMGLATTVSFAYYPGLPVMGIWDREISNINDEQVVFWDTRYAYIFTGGDFQEFVPGFIWGGTDADFFWTTNYRGITPDLRYFWATNFVNDAADPMRYFDGSTWINFAPGIAGATPTSADNTFLFQALILIPYFGRLLAFNTWEGTSIGTSVNIFNRVRFSQIGNPVQQTVVGPPFVGGAWRSDVFGKGGFIDAPTNEAIVSVTQYKNTLIVGFERSMWELRYVGEYGLPFIWNRISSDFGTESTYSPVTFDGGVLSVGDRAIVNATSVNVNRIDLAIPDYVFTFRNQGEGIARVNGERDYSRELVYWCYADAALQRKFPNYVLMFNYRNNTYARFRDSVTFFGTFQDQADLVTWDALDVFWNDEGVFWDDVAQEGEERVVAGNQQGWVHYYLSKYQQEDDPSLFITAIDMTVSPNTLIIPNHGLLDFEIIYLTNLLFDVAPNPVFNNRFFQVQVIDDNTVSLFFWDFSLSDPNYAVTPAQAAVTYLGCGEVTLFPKMFIQTKDFNPYQTQGVQLKLSYIDFLTDATPNGVVNIILGGNASGSFPAPTFIGNLITGNTQSEQYLQYPYYVTTPGNEAISDYAWHRFYATMSAQYINVIITYGDDLMNTLTTHQSTYVLNAMTLWTRPGSRNIF